MNGGDGAECVACVDVAKRAGTPVVRSRVHLPMHVFTYLSRWTEGQGLGKDGEGAAAPVNMSGGAEGAGVGVKETHEVEEGDNEFEQYRKRMMLAYRFRPNPLNNPRRSYY